jgi:hypothetical protein
MHADIPLPILAGAEVFPGDADVGVEAAQGQQNPAKAKQERWTDLAMNN